MKIAIIGAGFTGLSAAYELSKKGHKVTVFEKDKNPGGLAVGFKQKGWKWSLEKHYHHWFTNDKEIISLAKEIKFPVVTRRPKTSIYVNQNTYKLDSPLNVIFFPLLPIIDRFRLGFSIAVFRFNPFWKPLEKYNAVKILPKLMGKKAYEMIWEPLFINKFGRFSQNVSLAWFWARIIKRTPSLCYPKGGFLEFANSLTKKIEEKEGVFYFSTEVKKLESDNLPLITYQKENAVIETEEFDKVIVTTPIFIFFSFTPQLPEKYKNNILNLKSLGAINLVLRLKKPFFKDNTYWLSVCDKNAPVMAIVEHTNFIDKKNYNNEHLLYLGNYKERENSLFSMDANQILSLFDPYLKKINPKYSKFIIGYDLFKDPFAQPVIPVNYSKIIPKMITPLKNVYLANIEQVYPWDRGTNYAVELGKRVADKVI